ncbi:MAG: hypothetical protein ACTSXK_03040 [Promethearchaeota archaeon]
MSFIIKDLEGHTDERINQDFPENMTFIDAIRKILEILEIRITIDKIAVISATKGLFTYDDVRKTVKEIVDQHLVEFTITKRELVNGPNLMLKELIPTTTEKDSSKNLQFEHLKPQIEPDTTPRPEPIPVTSPEIQSEEISEQKALETEIMKEKIGDFEIKVEKKVEKKAEMAGRFYRSDMEEEKSLKNEIEDAKEAIDKMQEMLNKPSDEDQLLKAKIGLKDTDSVIEKEYKPTDHEEYKDISGESIEKEKPFPSPKSVSLPPGALPPPSGPPASSPAGVAPKSPPLLRGSALPELKALFKKREEKKSEPPVSKAVPPPPTLVYGSVFEKESIRESTPPPPPPSHSEPAKQAASLSLPSSKKKMKPKKAPMGLRSLADGVEGEREEKMEEEALKEEALEEKVEEFGEKYEAEESPMEPLPSLGSALVPELTKIANEIETRKEYQKNIAVEYYDKMNPKKYYPLLIDISDIEQETKISEENILTGERKTQVKEKMAVVLKSSIVKVKPMFPGCNIVPEERFTDLDEKEDKLIFYVTPLVDGDIEEGRIEFIDSEGNIFHEALTPSKVEDPRYARVIALYGGLISFIPKILETLGFSFVANLQMATLLPFMEFFFGDMNLSNFIGIAGIIVTAIISVITVLVRKPNSVKKKFKVARIGKLKSGIKLNH